MPRHCPCGREVRVETTRGPVAGIGSLKFYESAEDFGHPTSRQRVFLCDEHTEQFIQWLRSIDGTAVGGVPREKGS